MTTALLNNLKIFSDEKHSSFSSLIIIGLILQYPQYSKAYQ